MKIRIKLFESLRLERFKEANREYPEGISVATIVEELRIPEAHLGTILINGKHSEVDCKLSDGDVLSILPVLAGG